MQLQISVRGWRQFSRSEAEIEHRTENACGASCVGDLQLPAHRSPEGQTEADYQRALSVGAFQPHDVAAKDWLVPTVRERI